MNIFFQQAAIDKILLAHWYAAIFKNYSKNSFETYFSTYFTRLSTASANRSGNMTVLQCFVRHFVF